MLKRKLNYRPTWEVELQEPISGNYYPVTTKLSIQDDKNKLRLSALTDRAQGGSSLGEGEIELMVSKLKFVLNNATEWIQRNQTDSYCSYTEDC